ncbi:MAG: hypothetical protein M3164_00445 [Actinomycetota bacterium]|nr:hypothetical protein [Actinomycetota bacterium]
MSDDLQTEEPKAGTKISETEADTFDVPGMLDSVGTSRLRGPDAYITGRLLMMISSGIAVGILILIGILLFVSLTSADNRPPTPAELGALAENDKAIEAYKEVRTQRFQVVKDLLQLLVVALVVPLLTIVLGYIFGRQTTPRRHDVARD